MCINIYINTGNDVLHTPLVRIWWGLIQPIFLHEPVEKRGNI
jgi:hypothetical protein